ncbi:GNAT domain-containing protein [Desulfonema limicola]|uniref:GNAT domain-containing protein n=1 Tax=Desulfonema limicola TaxID=45656 RepID=A0A975BDG2_9BACT|nr:GNAT family N-acetyltransferase [Desulfonema limicola]QTA83629.1 GNAT domain-containing protein [Desulfonema limicola]
MIHYDKNGSPFEIRAYVYKDYLYLEAMYEAFKPKAMFQGMPPKDKDVAARWIKKLVQNGENILAWQKDKVAGHVVILPDYEKKDAEYLIFVSQSARGTGIGKELTLAAIKKAAELGMQVIWLTVDAYNFRATKLYRKIGFEFCEGYSSSSERMMIMKL